MQGQDRLHLLSWSFLFFFCPSQGFLFLCAISGSVSLAKWPSTCSLDVAGALMSTSCSWLFWIWHGIMAGSGTGPLWMCNSPPWHSAWNRKWVAPLVWPSSMKSWCRTVRMGSFQDTACDNHAALVPSLRRCLNLEERENARNTLYYFKIGFVVLCITQ